MNAVKTLSYEVGGGANGKKVLGALWWDDW